VVPDNQVNQEEMVLTEVRELQVLLVGRDLLDLKENQAPQDFQVDLVAQVLRDK
jgi:hypothetical protein